MHSIFAKNIGIVLYIWFVSFRKCFRKYLEFLLVGTLLKHTSTLLDPTLPGPAAADEATSADAAAVADAAARRASSPEEAAAAAGRSGLEAQGGGGGGGGGDGGGGT